MEVGRGWPFPAEWGMPVNIPQEALESNEAASRFLASWAAGKIRQRRRAGSGRRLTGREALRQIEIRIRNENRLRLVEVLERAAPPV